MKRQRSLSLLFLLLGILLIILWLPANRAALSSGEIRAAIDIGSGATNLKIAKVDPKTQKIVVQLFEKSIPVPYQKHLEQSSNNTFDQEVMTQGIQSIKALKEIADTYQVKKIVAVATAAFRQASNAQDFAREIQKDTGIAVRIINQDEEGILAFRGALALSAIPPEHALTWDIGGGSMQLTTLTPEGTYIVEKGQTASIPFKNTVIQHIQGRDIATHSSPNPLSSEQVLASIAYAKNLAESTTHGFIITKLQDPQTRVLAVGNLFNYGVKPLVDQKIVEQTALDKAVMKLADKTDAQLPGGSLSEVAVTNPILVLGYMQGLHIEKVQVINVNNTDGALTYPAYWE